MFVLRYRMKALLNACPLAGHVSSVEPIERNPRMLRNVLVGLLMLASSFIGSAAFADEPSLHQIYQAADAGKLNEAQTMMHEVLSAHPNSGKAHFVEAELLAKQGQFQKAEAELATAERLAPGLPFAKPQAVQDLRGLLGTSHSSRPVQVQHVQATPPVNGSSVPWGMLLVGIGLIAFILLAARFMARRNGVPAYGGRSQNDYGSGNVSPPYGAPMQPYGAGGAGAMSAQPGLGSRVMSGLATGAAVGAGVVAGEALMHHFMDGKGTTTQPFSSNDLGPSLQDSSIDDMGGTDFGIADTSSWDDASGSSDWN